MGDRVAKIPAPLARVMQDRLCGMRYPVKPEDHIDVRPFFYSVQCWCQVLVEHDPCDKAPVPHILIR